MSGVRGNQEAPRATPHELATQRARHKESCRQTGQLAQLMHGATRHKSRGAHRQKQPQITRTLAVGVGDPGCGVLWWRLRPVRIHPSLFLLDTALAVRALPHLCIGTRIAANPKRLIDKWVASCT